MVGIPSMLSDEEVSSVQRLFAAVVFAPPMCDVIADAVAWHGAGELRFVVRTEDVSK